MLNLKVERKTRMISMLKKLAALQIFGCVNTGSKPKRWLSFTLVTINKIMGTERICLLKKWKRKKESEVHDMRENFR